MLSLSRLIVNIEMLSEEMRDLLAGSGLHQAEYIELLEQYLKSLKQLNSEIAAQGLTEQQFAQLLAGTELVRCINARRMVSVQIRLIEYVLAYCDADTKAQSILATDFAENADKRLNMLQTKAIKMRKQFKTVADAMGKVDYANFVDCTPLPNEDWQWHRLF